MDGEESPASKDEPQHIKQGMITEELLKILGIHYEVIDKDTAQEEIDILIEKQTKIAFKEMSPVALLIKGPLIIIRAVLHRMKQKE